MVRKLSDTGPRALPTPTVDQADENGFISLENLQRGLTLRLPAFSGQPGMRVSMVLSFSHHSSRWEVVILRPDADVVISVPPAEAMKFVDVPRLGLQAAYFFGESITYSPLAYFSTGAQAFAPTVDEATDNVIPATASRFTVRIRPFEGMAAGDLVELYILGSAPNSSARVNLLVEDGDVGRDITFSTNALPYRSDMVHLAYEVYQSGRVLTPNASTFTVEGLLHVARPIHLVEEGRVSPSLVAVKYEGENWGVPFDFTIPEDHDREDRYNVYAIPSFGRPMLIDGRFGDARENIRIFLPYDRVLEMVGQDVFIGYFVEFSSGGGSTLSAPIGMFKFLESPGGHSLSSRANGDG